MLVGFIGLTLLPVDQYPDIVPPVVRVTASYPGASAQTVAQAVATPIEQELNGTPGMLYMQSTNTNSGSFTANITFDISSNPDLAAVEVQNRVKQAEARLPAEVVQNGISVEKVAADTEVTFTGEKLFHFHDMEFRVISDKLIDLFFPFFLIDSVHEIKESSFIVDIFTDAF